ncbi:MAG: TonB-dependent siderophore receptor [Proteobacteria bacterium]|nr:TonB-dependent siderophore receptor [Pseudomonadota bacterium]
MMGLLVGTPVAMAQQASPSQPSPAPTPPDQPNATKPADTSSMPTATMTPITVTGSRPSDDFAPPAPSLNRLGAGDVRDIPQSVVIVNKALMQSQGATSLTSAVRNVPGITIGAAEGGQIGNNININGFTARTDLFVDGMRDRGQYYRDIFALDQIEVLFGPSSMLFGRGSTGGVINQVLKKPSLQAATEITGAVTTNGLVRSTVDVNTPTGDHEAFRANAMIQKGKVSTRGQTDVLDLGFAPSYKLGIGTPTGITLYALVQHNWDQADYGLPPVNGWPANVDRNNAYGFNDDRTMQNILTLGATVDHKFDKNLSLRNQTQFNWVNTNARETAPQSVGTIAANGSFVAAPAGGFTAVSPNNLYVRQQSHDRNIFDVAIDNQTELTWKFDTGPVEHNLLTGIELGYESYYNQNSYRPGTCNGVPLQSPFATNGYVGCTSLYYPSSSGDPGGPQIPSNLATAQARSFAGYFNDTITVIPQLKLVGGVRYDVYWAQIGNTINTLNTAGNNTLAYADQTTTFASVRGGVIWQPTQEQTYYVSYSTSFNPSLEQLVSTTGVSQPLPPETNESIEGGAKLGLLDDNLSLTGALFQITKQNARSQNNDGTFTATGTIRVRGVRTGVAGRITPEWQVFGGYTYLDAVILNGIGVGTTGNQPINTPRDSANLWTTYTFDGKYEIGGGATYIGQRYANNTDSTVVPGFVRFDATAAYRQPTYDVRLNVFNVLNATYYDQIIASDGGRVVPGSGLTAMLTLTHRM